MLFQEALAKMQTGESMCRTTWSLQDGYLKLMDGMQFIWKIVLLPSPNAGNYIFSLEDFLADDWINFIPPQEKVIKQETLTAVL